MGGRVIHFICNLNLNLVARRKSQPWNLSSEINENENAEAVAVAVAVATKSAAINIQIQIQIRGRQTHRYTRRQTEGARNAAPSSLFQTNCKDPESRMPCWEEEAEGHFYFVPKGNEND